MKPSKGGGKKPAAADADVKADSPRLPWTARIWSSVGLPWISVGLATYTGLTLLARTFIHNQDGLEVLRREVPIYVYDRSSSIFLTALAIDLLNIVFERQTIKLDCVLLPTFIKGMASTTNLMVRFFTPVIALTEAGRPVVVQRYICWLHTTPTILLLLKMISSTITPREALTTIVFDEIMVIAGALALITTGWQRVLWSIVTHVAMLPVVPYMHKAFTECMAAARERRPGDLAQPWWSAGGEVRRRSAAARAMEQVSTRPLQLTMLLIYVLNLALWCTFAVTWDLALLGWISVATEEVLYVGCDFSAKVLFSSTLMLSSFKEFEARRENAMRVIEGSSKAKLISELQALLEQKERFMSSVSHELRTPLNGIIGISEGMLSGCCGVLPEGVRRQIYIIRTSGARLLALINDVMDAAALRQNKLVLKQEQVVLRHVVDDVLDLTRSLVDGEVVLANLVPARMLVMGDTGRIVQILNNLLGNAAKFTRRGQIRVTARQVDGGRKVAVTVSDTGIGIPRNKLATIFLPFEQVDMSISRKYGGFGLGLNIVQELVKAHGGTINVSSIEGKGSAFTFTLPLARAMGRESLEEAKAAAQRTGLTANQASKEANAAAAAAAAGPGADDARGGSGSHSGGPAGAASATASGTTLQRDPGGGDGGDDSSSVLSSSDASRKPGRRGQGLAGTMTADSELEQYGELMYNAAELSALASSRPYAQSVRESLPASCEGGSAVQLPVVGRPRGAAAVAAFGAAVAARGSAEAGSTSKASMAGTAAGGGGGASGTAPPPAGDASGAALKALPGSERIVHGPRPFHYTMYKRFLLLSVDDDLVNQSVVQSLLGSTGYEVVAVSSGPEALRYVATAPALPDLVLLDCMMPEMDGYEVLQRLRAMTPNVHLPIIMVSAQTEEEHVVCGLDLGADDYVTKPFKRNELLARIRAQLAYGEWEQDEGALETITSMVGGGDFSQHGPPTGRTAASPVRGGGGGGLGILDSGNAFSDAAAVGGGAAVAAAVGAGGSIACRTSSPGASGGDQRLIVCIDDDDVNQVVLQGMLTSQHYRYVRASTGAQGLSYVCGTQSGGIPPDLVLLDCSLPDMTGFDVCRCIRQMYNKQQVPIIMLSARHNESAVVEGLKCGANTYVTKPFRRNELLARIRLHLRSREIPPAVQPVHTDSSTPDESDSRAATAAAASALSDSSLGLPAPRPPRTTDASAAAAAAAGGDGGVRVWADAAVLVVAVADYAGLCRMLLPSEMAELSSRMLAAFDRAVAAHGVVKIEAGSGVMSAALLPAAPAAAPPPSQDGSGGDAAAAAAAGLRVAALHRVGRALLEAAATLPVPGTATCLQLQQALALGTIMGHRTAAPAMAPAGAAATTMLYFGPVLAELLDLARRAPPMTIVAPDAEAYALRYSGATADIRGPLFLDGDDGGGGGGGAALAGRRLWLVEAHPFAYQYLPPQLLYASSGLRSSFLHRSGTEEYDKASSSVHLGGISAAAAATAATALLQPQLSLTGLAPPPHPQPPPQPGQQQLAAQQQYQQAQYQQPLLSPQPLLQQHLQQQQTTATTTQPTRPGSLSSGVGVGVGAGTGAGVVGYGGTSLSSSFTAQALASTGVLPPPQQPLGNTAGTFAAGGFPPGPPFPPHSLAPNPAAAGGLLTSAVHHFDAGAAASGGQASPVSNSMGYNTSVGLYGNGVGMSRAGSRAYSHTNFVMELEGAQGRATTQGLQHLTSSVSASASASAAHHSSGNGASHGSGNGAAAAAAACAAPTGAAPTSTSATMMGTNGSGSAPYTGGCASNALDSSSGGPCITFSLQAAAAAVATATAAAAAGVNGSDHPLPSPENSLMMQTGASTSTVMGTGGGGSGYGSTPLASPSFLYGSAFASAAQRVSANPHAAAGGGLASPGSTGIIVGPGGGSHAHGLILDPDIMAAEPQIRALRNELAAMRQQLEVLQSSSGRDNSAALPSALLGHGAVPLPYAHPSQPLAPSPLGLPPLGLPLPPTAAPPSEELLAASGRPGGVFQRPSSRDEGPVAAAAAGAAAAGGITLSAGRGGFVAVAGEGAAGPGGAGLAAAATAAAAVPGMAVHGQAPPAVPSHVHVSPPSGSGASGVDAASAAGGGGDGSTGGIPKPAKKFSKIKSLFGRSAKAAGK